MRVSVSCFAAHSNTAKLVEKMVEVGYISRNEGDRLLGVHRVMLRVSMS
jgi:hypothetical protein